MWSAAVDLGMVAVIHVGNTYATSAGGPTSAGTSPEAAASGALVRLVVHAASSTSPKNLLSSLLFGGVFHRHPDLTVVLEEMGVGWIPSYVDMCGRQSKSSVMMGDWPFELSGDELLRRNVRFTPLPGSTRARPSMSSPRCRRWPCSPRTIPTRKATLTRSTSTATRSPALDPVTLERFMGANAADAYRGWATRSNGSVCRQKVAICNADLHSLPKLGPPGQLDCVVTSEGECHVRCAHPQRQRRGRNGCAGAEQLLTLAMRRRAHLGPATDGGACDG